MESLAKSKTTTRIKMKEYCNSLGYAEVTDACIRKAKKSQDKEVRAMATKAMSKKNLDKGS